MNWICIGLLAGSLVTSLHENEEACRGRQAMQSKAGATSDCYKMPSKGLFGTSYSGNILTLPNSSCNAVHLDGSPAC